MTGKDNGDGDGHAGGQEFLTVLFQGMLTRLWNRHAFSIIQGVWWYPFNIESYSFSCSVSLLGATHT